MLLFVLGCVGMTLVGLGWLLKLAGRGDVLQSLLAAILLTLLD